MRVTFGAGVSSVTGPSCQAAAPASTQSMPVVTPVVMTKTLPASPEAGDKVAPNEDHCSEECGKEVGASWEVGLTPPSSLGGRGGPLQGGARQSRGDGDGLAGRQDPTPGREGVCERGCRGVRGGGSGGTLQPLRWCSPEGAPPPAPAARPQSAAPGPGSGSARIAGGGWRSRPRSTHLPSARSVNEHDHFLPQLPRRSQVPDAPLQPQERGRSPGRVTSLKCSEVLRSAQSPPGDTSFPC